MQPAEAPLQEITPRQTDFDPGIVATVLKLLPEVRAVYRYGSAGGVFERADSDIDIALLTEHPLSFDHRTALTCALMDQIGRDVDVVDMHAIPVTLRVQIVAQGARLYEAANSYAAAFETHTFSDYARLNEERRGILEDIRQRGSIH